MLNKIKKIIFVYDGETDFDFLQKAFSHDPRLSKLRITPLKPEEVKLQRRRGGGHKSLLKDALFAAMRAAQGHADGVFVLVDNDKDSRFKFPHNDCSDCRECEAIEELEKVKWGEKFEKGASILYQAVETILLSAKKKR